MAIPLGTSATRQTSGRRCAAASQAECSTAHPLQYRASLRKVRLPDAVSCPPISFRLSLSDHADSLRDGLRRFGDGDVGSALGFPLDQLHLAARELLPNGHAVRNADQVGIFEFYARAFIAVVEERVQT